MSGCNLTPMLLHQLSALRDDFRSESDAFHKRNRHGLTLICEHSAPSSERMALRRKFDEIFEPETIGDDPTHAYSNNSPSDLSEELSGKGAWIKLFSTNTYYPRVGTTGLTDYLGDDVDSDETERRFFVNTSDTDERGRFHQLCERAGKVLIALPLDLPIPISLATLQGEWNRAAPPFFAAWQNALIDTACLSLDGMAYLRAQRFWINSSNRRWSNQENSSGFSFCGLPDVYIASSDFAQWLLLLATKEVGYPAIPPGNTGSGRGADVPDATDVFNGKTVLKSMATKHPTVEAFRDAFRKAGYSASNTKLGAIFRALMKPED